MPEEALADNCEESIILLETCMSCLEIQLGGCLRGGREEPMRHARKLLQWISNWKTIGSIWSAYCKHRFGATKRSNGRVFEQRRCMYGLHLYIPR